MKFKYLVSGIAAISISAPVFATDEGEGYVGAQLSKTTYEEAGLPDANPTAIIGRLGYFVVDNFAIEGRLGTGIADDSISAFGMSADIEIDSVAGIYGVGHLPLGDVASVYGVAGFSRGEATASGSGGSFSGDDTDFSYGIGFQAKFSPTFSGHVEYMSYLEKSDYELTAIGLGLNYHF